MEELDIANIFLTIREKKKIIIGILLISILIGTIYSFLILKPKYESTCKILTEKADESITSIFESDDVYNAIIKNLKIQNLKIEELKNDIINLEYESKNKTIKISVQDENKENAQKIANETCNILISKLQELYNMKNSKIIEQASSPENPCNIDHIRDIGVSIIIGMILAFLYIVIYNIYCESIKNREEIENATDMSVLGVIPMHQNKDTISYFIKNLRTNIEFNKNNPRPRSLLVTSFMQEEGKSYIVSNLAISFAETGKNVLLIDADMIEGKQHEIFNIESQKGLSDILKKINELDKINIEEYIKKTKTKNLSIITLGDKVTNSSELLMSNKFKSLLEKLKEKFDLIIFDSTPSLNISDAIILSSYADASLIVAEYNKTKLQDLIKLENNIKNVGGKITGVVMNKLPIKHKECKILDKYSNKIVDKK